MDIIPLIDEYDVKLQSPESLTKRGLHGISQLDIQHLNFCCIIFFAFGYPAGVTDICITMATSKKTRDELERNKRLAYTLFVDNGLEQKVISKITGISETSISKWKKEGDWDEERRIALLGPERQMRRIIKIHDAMLTLIENREPPKNIPDSKEADILNKLADTARKLRTEDTFFVKSEVGKQFISHMQETYGHVEAVKVLEYWHNFLMSHAQNG